MEKGEGRGALLEMKATWILGQEADPGGVALVDACNGFNDLRRLTMLYKVRHH